MSIIGNNGCYSGIRTVKITETGDIAPGLVGGIPYACFCRKPAKHVLEALKRDGYYEIFIARDNLPYHDEDLKLKILTCSER